MSQPIPHKRKETNRERYYCGFKISSMVPKVHGSLYRSCWDTYRLWKTKGDLVMHLHKPPAALLHQPADLRKSALLALHGRHHLRRCTCEFASMTKPRNVPGYLDSTESHSHSLRSVATELAPTVAWHQKYPGCPPQRRKGLNCRQS